MIPERNPYIAYAGFSIPLKKDLGSAIIVHFEGHLTPGARFSHCFPVLHVGIGLVIMDANKGDKIRMVSLAEKCKLFDVELLPFPTNPERYARACDEIVRFEGSPYGTLQLIGEILPMLRISKNPFDKNTICSELLAIFILNCLDESPLAKRIEADILAIGIDEITPAQIYAILSTTP